MIYTKQQIVGSTQVGANAQLSAMGVFGVVESAITECMGSQHIDGLTTKRLYNAFWVFTKNCIKIYDSAHWGEVLAVQSFISGVSLVKMTVDTVLKKSDGTLVAYSRCEMCALDASTGRIRRTSTVGINESIAVETPLMEVAFEKFDESNLPQVETVTVRSTNIDFCQHCNNVEYLRFLFNTYKVSELIDNPVKEIQVDYINQSYEGDALAVHKLIDGNRDLLSITNGSQTVIRCLIRH